MKAAIALFTPRQRQVLKLVAEDHNVKSIANQLGLSPKTVEWHKSKLYRELNCGLAGLVRAALKLGLVKL